MKIGEFFRGIFENGFTDDDEIEDSGVEGRIDMFGKQPRVVIVFLRNCVGGKFVIATKNICLSFNASQRIYHPVRCYKHEIFLTKNMGKHYYLK